MRCSLIRGLFACGLCLVLAGCASGGDESKPGETLDLYVSAYMNGNYEEAWQHLSSEDRSARSLEAYIAERKDSGTFLARNLHRLMGYTVRDVAQVDETHACGTVEFSIPDFRAIVGEVSGALEAAAYPESALENVSFVRRNVGAFEQKYQTEGIPRRMLQEKFELIREGRQWKIRAGWGLGEPRRR